MRPTRSARHRSTIGQIRKGCPQSAAEPPRSITSVRMIFFMLSSSFRYEDNILPDARPLDARKHTTGSVTLHRKASVHSAAPGAVQPALYTEYGFQPWRMKKRSCSSRSMEYSVSNSIHFSRFWKRAFKKFIKVSFLKAKDAGQLDFTRSALRLCVWHIVLLCQGRVQKTLHHLKCIPERHCDLLSKSIGWFFKIQLSKNCICSFVWNQCSPLGITVSSALIFSAKAFMVSLEVRLSFSPYKMHVGIFHEIGCSRT